MTNRDKIEQLEYAIKEARSALSDDYYMACFPGEEQSIKDMILDCERHINVLTELTY